MESRDLEIPLKIFQTWSTKKLPEKMQIIIDDLKNKNSEFEHFLFDDNDCEEFIKNNFNEEVLYAFNNLIPGTFKADLWRYCILYIYGGIYLDIKFVCVNGFKFINIVDKEYFVKDELCWYATYDDYKGLIWNGMMVAKPKNEILMKCINEIASNVKNKFYGISVYDPTGPLLLSKYFTTEEKQNFPIYRSRDHENDGVKMNDIYILTEYKEYREDRRKNNSDKDYVYYWCMKNMYKNIDTYSRYSTNHGSITLFTNEMYIGEFFKNNTYWIEDILFKIKNFVNPNKNILEIGGHCGSSSIILSKFIEDERKVYVYEPQRKLYNLLVENIKQNSLQDKIIPFNMGIFCYCGTGNMNDVDLDGEKGIISKRYNEEYFLPCNFGGVTLGINGEEIELITLDELEEKHDDIGFIFCSAQGSESFIFSKSINLITKYRPVIFFVNNKKYHNYQFHKIMESYPDFIKEGEFDIVNYCITNLDYTLQSDIFENDKYILLIPQMEREV
jgi:FkbM family methyltransferase